MGEDREDGCRGTTQWKEGRGEGVQRREESVELPRKGLMAGNTPRLLSLLPWYLTSSGLERSEGERGG